MSTPRRTPRRSRRRFQRGMTLLEIMIVLAILALVMGLLLGPRILRAFQSSKTDTQRAMVQKYVFEGYTQWSIHNPTKGCPASLSEIADELGYKDTKDGWGHELIMFCGDNLPPGAAKDHFAVMSLGEDGQQNTKDDIKSWE